MKFCKTILLSLVGLFMACSMEDPHGFPKVVEMPAEGKTLRLNGAGSPYHIDIVNKRGEVFISPFEGDTLVASCEWLTVKHKRNEYILILTAEPNTTGRTRELNVHASFAGNTYTNIEVVQKK